MSSPGYKSKIDFKQVSSAALNQLASLVSGWLPDGKKAGPEWKARNPTRSDTKPGSFSINLNTGVWSDFATGESGGDAISLYSYLHSLSPLDAAREVAAQIGMSDIVQPSVPAKNPRTEWLPVLPVPGDAGPYPKAHPIRGLSQMHWEYRNQSGALLGVIYRFQTSDGGKEVMPCVYARHPVSGKCEWRWLSFPSPRPLYGLDRLRDGAPVLVVEGEKCADAGHDALSGTFDVVSWPGGGKAVDKADWSFLAGRNVLIWPDCDAQREKLSKDEQAAGVLPESKPILPEIDQPGIKAAEAIAAQLLTHGAKVRIVVIPAPGEKPSGWDIADAIAEGWGFDQIIEYLRANQRAPADSPVPLLTSATATQSAVVTPKLDSLIAHYALVYGKTDVWDSLNRQLIKKAGFVALIGNELAKQWLAHPDRRTIDTEALPKLRRGRAIEEGAGGGLVVMLQRFVLLYGTVTVWDNELRKVVAMESMRMAYSTDDKAKRWLDHPARLMIDADNLVFDPTQKVSPDTHVNMFEGFPVHSKQDEVLCQPIIDLLYEMCASEGDLCSDTAHWILRWIAYQFKNPGAKMQTAVLMFGEKQGTGKSLFWEGIVRALFGKYGTTAGQHQLDSQFTEWRSCKLFVLFEEVLSRNDRYNHLGTIKHMITGRDQRINPKGLPERVEANHMNCVFLSNEPQPIPLELEDRRFMVVEARNRITNEFKDRVVHSINNGGIAAFYHFLLNYDLGDFDPHTKPLRTTARDKIVSFGMPGWEVFYREWKDERLSVPYCSCLTSDLYQAYRRWCDRAYEKPLTLTKFSCLLSNRETKSKQEVWFSNKRSTFMVFEIYRKDETESLNKQCNRFRESISGREES